MTRLTLALFVAVVGAPGAARACGCFHDPSPVQPVVQTGERILFHVDKGQVTAHIQISYQGVDAAGFGWTLPLPSVPTLEVGDDAVFTALGETTGPLFTVVTNPGGGCRNTAYSVAARGGSGWGCGGFGSGRGGGDGVATSPDPSYGSGRPNPVVIADSIGPYDFAVLKADDRTALLGWLRQNRFFLPTASDDTLEHYLGPGRYFLALRLQPGRSAGDIKPVIVHYASDLPMIPLTLTAATSTPVLPVTVWLLGPGRAIPRNYHHTVLNEAALSWLNEADNYAAVAARAALEAPAGHAFITEFAGTSASVRASIPRAYQGLFESQPRLTRLFTAISATSMTADPVFGFNADLPDVAAGHVAYLTTGCPTEIGRLDVPGGFTLAYGPGGLATPAMPASRRIEILREEGPPELVTDNSDAIRRALGGQAAPAETDAGSAGGDPDGGDDPDGGIALGDEQRSRRGELAILAFPVLAGALRLRRRRR